MALIIALIGLLGIVGLVAWNAPDLTLFLPVVLLALSAGVFLFARPRLNFILWLGGLATLFSSEVGIQAHEAVYGLYFYGYLLHWYGRRIFLYKSRFVRGVEDHAALLLLVFGLLGGIALGLLFDAKLMDMRGEVLSFSMLALYFPVKEFVVREKNGPLIVLALIVWIGLFVTVNNALYTRHQFVEATALWQVADVRIAGRELILTFAAILLVSVLAVVRTRMAVIGVLTMLVTLLAGLVLTKSRSFWVAFLIGGFVLLLLHPAADRRRLLVRSVFALLTLLAAASIAMGPYFTLLLHGVVDRFLSLGATGTDISLLNRFVESNAVRAHTIANPILGYGFGTEYSFYSVAIHATLVKSYIHHGYLAVWYKFGLWGVMLWSVFLLRSAWCALQAARKSQHPIHRAIMFGVVACFLALPLPAYTHSVFLEGEKLSALALVAALGCGLYQRQRLMREGECTGG